MKWQQRDPSLPHQIILNFRTDRRYGVHVVVSCNCQVDRLGHYEPMGISHEIGDAWAIYNSPGNHNNFPYPFTHDMQAGPAYERRSQEDHQAALRELDIPGLQEGAPDSA